MIAVGVLAFHLLDDSFLQPQPGTSGVDHLVSGLIPLAILALAAWFYPRLRAGARAPMAIVLGLLGMVTSAEAIHYWRDGGMSGDDYTGLLTIPAGLSLIVLGAVTLWRTRRTDNGLPVRYLRRVGWTALGLVTAFVVLFPLSIAYVITHAARDVVVPARLGAAYENVSLTTGDGLRLQGWYVPSKNRAAVIAFPGRKGPQEQARMLVRHGYGVLLFDRRGEGDSQGDPNALGWAGERDLDAAVAFLQGRADVDRERIGGIGLSVGGELLLQAAAESDGLKAVVSDGAGARSIREDLGAAGERKVGGGPGLARDHGGRGPVLEPHAPAEPEEPRAAHRPARGDVHLRGERSVKRGGADAQLLRGRR